MKPGTERVGERVRRLRENQGLTLANLSEPGITYAYLSRVETGARHPSLTALCKLADRLGVTALYLETGSDDGVCPHCRRAAR